MNILMTLATDPPDAKRFGVVSMMAVNFCALTTRFAGLRFPDLTVPDSVIENRGRIALFWILTLPLLKHENAKIGRAFYEGTVAKRVDSFYPIGTRPKQKTHLWVKHRWS